MREVVASIKRMIRGAFDAGEDTRALPSGANVAASATARDGVYARGFLLSRTGKSLETLSDWPRWNIADWQLWVDPRVPVNRARDGGREVWIVGDAFHPSGHVFREVAEWILKGDLEHKLDGLAGRFLLIHLDGTRLEIYHDALGARSVFYGTNVVASHSSLAAEVTRARLRDWVLPFITSRAYLKRDVKYLPGLDSPFEGILQLTPNCKLLPDRMSVQRYWPRAARVVTTPDTALEALIVHLEGLKEYFLQNGLRPVMGLTGGTDSRGVLAALGDLGPKMFTIVRSRDGQSVDSPDSRTARALAECTGLDLHIVKAAAPAPLDNASSSFAKAFRRNTGEVRGANAGWLEHCIDLDAADHLFVRGFGGEVMRGFYRHIEDFDAPALAHLYGVQPNSRMTIDAFERFARTAEWSEIQGTGYRADEMIYWEHRMGVWGASALTEADMVFRSMPGYNSRALYATFLGLPGEVDRRALFHLAISRMAPHLDDVPYAA
ncbi:hypothetical protein [Luteimonas qiangzhengi]|uniref:hypothetical protein n=1 Tax=Luteimonas sp. MJ146 TaxID=3129240 RepID=UPI0031BBB81B